MERMRAAGLEDVPVIVGGIIPDADAEALRGFGVARVYTPKDFELNRIMLDIVEVVDAEAARLPDPASCPAVVRLLASAVPRTRANWG